MDIIAGLLQIAFSVLFGVAILALYVYCVLSDTLANAFSAKSHKK